MSSNPQTPGQVPHNGTAGEMLSALASANAEIALGLQVGAIVLPLAKGIIRAVKDAVSGEEVIEYTVAISKGQVNLDHAMAVDDAIVADVNAELIRQGVAPLPTGQ